MDIQPAIEQPEGIGGAEVSVGRSVRAGLKDSSIVVVKLARGKLVYKSAFAKIEVPLEDLDSFSNGSLRLKDGTLLKGEVVEGTLTVDTQFGRHELPAKEIVSIDVIRRERAGARG